MAREFTAFDELKLQMLLDVLEERRQEGLPLPPNIFNAFLKHLPQIALECVMLRRNDDGTPRGSIRVYLTYRGNDTPSHQNTWHVPGAFLRSRDRIADVMARISSQELHSATITSWQFLRLQNCHQEPRGHTVSCVYLCRLAGESRTFGGSASHAYHCPPVGYHHDVIATAVQHFLVEPFLRHPL